MNVSKRIPPPSPEVLRTLRPIERMHFGIARRMNGEPFKGFYTFLQRNIGATVIHGLVRRYTVVSGLEHLEAADHSRPILLLPNHRSYYDRYIVGSVLVSRLPWLRRIYFPVRGRYYYESFGGMVLNGTAAFWSMFPPLFATARHQAFDRYSVDLLASLCREGAGTLVGIHPEGGRNTDPDPYSLRKLQPGAGRIIHAAHPQVIPVFIGGLGNDIAPLFTRNWRAGPPVRIRCGATLDLESFYALPPKGSTYKSIVEFAMERVRELGEEDRAEYGVSTAAD
jgi:1-acyl-sn-glycerol-3-phosphate acyltransferase